MTLINVHWFVMPLFTENVHKSHIHPAGPSKRTALSRRHTFEKREHTFEKRREHPFLMVQMKQTLNHYFLYDNYRNVIEC
jgi:hypothetical protein